MKNDQIDRPSGIGRQMQIAVASMLGFGLHGLLLLHALERPGEPWPWVLYVGFLVLFVPAIVFAVRRGQRKG